MTQPNVYILLQHEIKEYMTKILDPYDLANLLRALRYKPSSRDIAKFLNPRNHIFYKDDIVNTLIRYGCKMVLIGNSLKYADIQLNVSSDIWNPCISDKLVKTFCLVLCTNTNHEHHKLERYIRRGSNVFIEICEVKLNNDYELGFVIGDTICINASVAAERTGQFYNFEAAFERRYASNITGLKSCCYISYPHEDVGLKVTDRQLLCLKETEHRDDQMRNTGNYNYLILYFRMTEILDDIIFEGYKFSLF